ncbi:hypothetical protein [Longimicrobium sp.]|uniref:hypothetical protein n=1 Tax=Longimicrobium sp. TaxID=2029185 RepID=UPI002BF5A3FC|nr:hypothetical protein [Longimicrobium sp.]HSU15673.1 hypothetical protein [Longimicrobium sp.]
MTEADAGVAPEPRREAGPFLTPYEMAFGEAGFENRLFPRIQAEADEHGEDPLARERFGFLTLAGDAARDMVPADAPPEMLEEYRALLYHAFNFWRFGRRTYALDAAVARFLVEAAPSLEGWRLSLPVPSVYVRMPPNLFWASIATDVPPEPVDGFFATTCEGRDPLGGAYHDLHVLMVLGLRRGRAGFSVIPFDTEVGPGIPATWAEGSRDGARDFENILPGGEMAGLYSILTTGEVLKILARAMWYVEAHPEDVEAFAAPERRGEDRPGQVPLSRLGYHRVRLSGGGSIAPQGAAG